MKLSNQNNLLKIAIEEGCKTVSDFAAFIKMQQQVQVDTLLAA